jgi:hypothetical protein
LTRRKMAEVFEIVVEILEMLSEKIGEIEEI